MISRDGVRRDRRDLLAALRREALQVLAQSGEGRPARHAVDLEFSLQRHVIRGDIGERSRRVESARKSFFSNV